MQRLFTPSAFSPNPLSMRLFSGLSSSFNRRHIDEKIIRMRIDVGDVSDAQLPPTLTLLLGVGFIVNYDLQKFGFFRLEVALDGLDHTQRSPLGGTVSLKAARQLTAERSRQSPA
jgi:hypothetical protein